MSLVFKSFTGGETRTPDTLLRTLGEQLFSLLYPIFANQLKVYLHAAFRRCTML